MGKVDVGILKKGMVLEEDLYTPDGKCILYRGDTLSEHHIRMLKIWGVLEATVEDGGLPQEFTEKSEKEPSPLYERACRLVNGWFPLEWEEQPLMVELHKICATRVARSMEDKVLLEGLFPKVQTKAPETPQEEDLDFSPLSLVVSGAQLVSYPDIYFRIREVLSSPVSSARHIAEVVSKDPNLSMRLLRLVNSAFYGLPYPVESISRAVIIIGSRELTNLALAVSTMSIFDGIPEEYVEMRSFWEHSLACGVIARILANLRKYPEEERFFLAGLFHDTGKLLLYSGKPLVMRFILDLSRYEKLPMFQVEERILGFTHAHIGGLLLKEWNIPQTLRQLVQEHHSPEVVAYSPESAIIHIADILAGAMRWGSSGSFHIPPLNQEAWESLNISPGALEMILTQAERQMREIKQVFFGKEEPHEDQ